MRNFVCLVVKPLCNDIEHNNIPHGVNSKTIVNMILSEDTWNLIQNIIHKYPQECFCDPNRFDNEVYINLSSPQIFNEFWKKIY